MGACYFVTVKSAGREPIFLLPAAAGIVVRCVDWMEAQARWRWLCFTVMPDHLHLVFTLKMHKPLGDLLRSFKGYTADRINKTLYRKGTVWQHGYFDHRIRHDEKLEPVAFYCFRNPVHAGLVLDGGDWPFWRCKHTLWSKVLGNVEDLLALEMEKKGWSPPVAAGEV